MDNKELTKRIKWYEKKYGPYIEKRGQQNWKNLFRKPNVYECTIFFMLLMSFFLAFAYYSDINNCQETLKEWKPIIDLHKSTLINQTNFPINLQGDENINFVDDSLE